jgi:dolichol-phosphate mannosyltransferase
LQLSVVVPVRNEQDNIEPLLDEIHAALEGRVDYEVVYVDDGSNDATPARLAEALSRHPRLRVLAHAASCGQSAALVSGFRAARGEWIATLDGDGQNDPADIQKLMSARDAARDSGNRAELQLIAGHRRKRQDTWLKRVSSRIANGVRSRLLGDATPDTGCGLKLILRRAVLELPVFDHMHRFLPALIQRNGGFTVSVEVNHRPRTRGTSNYGMFDRLWVGIVDLFGVMWLKRRQRRPQVVERERPRRSP